MTERDDPTTATWTVVTWNVHGRARPRVNGLADALRPYTADVVALQEVRWWQAHHLAWRLQMKVDWRLKHFPFSRLAFLLAEGAAILTPHDLGGTDAQVISTETQTTTYRRRIAQWAHIERHDGSALRVFNVHLSPESLAEERLVEARRLTVLASEGELAETVIAGDLNDADERDVIATLPLVEHVRPASTNPADTPTQVLDHVLLPAAATHLGTDVPSGSTEWSTLSDHLPVIVRFGLGATERR